MLRGGGGGGGRIGVDVGGGGVGEGSDAGGGGGVLSIPRYFVVCCQIKLRNVFSTCTRAATAAVQTPRKLPNTKNFTAWKAISADKIPD